MREVLISIKPRWCELIASGKKTVEVRKTKPKLETPFKVYIYCTNPKGYAFFSEQVFEGKKGTFAIPRLGNSKVIGEFVCDRISGGSGEYAIYHTEGTCLTPTEMADYIGDKYAYYWHISDLVIYDKPRELSEFHKPCADIENCLNRAFRESGRSLDKCFDCGCKITRPPQSWCYIEPWQTAD